MATAAAAVLVPLYNTQRQITVTRGDQVGGIFTAFVFGGIVGSLSGALAGLINEQFFLKSRKIKEFHFEYIDKKGYPVAR
eukprot:3599665-Prymnesium_polylepis.1